MRFRRSLSLSLALAGAFALAGCTPPAAEPTAWQGVVQTLASQASGGDYASALATLDQLEAEVTAQRDTGTLATDAAEAILSRMATVRADLTSLAPSPEPTAPVSESTPEPSQSTVTDDDDGDDEQDAEEPQPEPEQPAPADPGDTGPGNSGPDAPGSGNPGPEKDDKGKDDKGKSEGAPGRSGSAGGPGNKDG